MTIGMTPHRDPAANKDDASYPGILVILWNRQPDNTLPYDSGRRSVRSGLPAPKLGRQRRTVLKLSYRGIP